MSPRVFRPTRMRLCLLVLGLAGFTQSISLPLGIAVAHEAHRGVVAIAQHEPYTQPGDPEGNTQTNYHQEVRKDLYAPATEKLEDRGQQTGSDHAPKLYLPAAGQESASPSPQGQLALPDFTIPLTSGVPVSGTIGAASPGGCGLGGNQYTITVPAGATQLKIDLAGSGAQDIDLFARFAVPIEILGGQLIADHSSTSLFGFESITITPTSAPSLRQGTYFVGIGNCSPAVANFTLTATVAGNQIIPLASGVPVNGNIPAALPDACLLGGTQYTILVPANATQLRIDLSGNQDVDLFARFGQAVEVQGGQAVADHSARTVFTVESIDVTPSSSPPLRPGTYFIAIANCGQATVNFTITATVTNAPPASMPNLTPFQPAGWSDKIVVSTVTGTHSDTGAIRAADTLFVDWAVRNSGTAGTTARFVVKLFVDGAERGSWFADPPLNPGAHGFVDDFSIGSLAAGAHSIRITADTQNNIAETSESDNEYTKSISVSAQTCTTLTINVTPNDGGTVSSSSQATCQAPLSLAEQLTAASSPVHQTPGVASPSSRDNSVGQAFAELISKAETDGSVRVIVGLQEPFQTEGTLDGPVAIRLQHDRIARVQVDLLSRMSAFNVQSIKRLETVPFIVMQVDAAGLRFLESWPNVMSIEEDIKIPPALAESISLIGAPAAWASGHSAAGQAIAILDSGVDKNHPFLAGKVVSEACYSTTDGISTNSVCPGGLSESTSLGSGVNCLVANCNHGTHVAGIAAGRGSSFSGVAKDANIIAIQVFSRENSQSSCGQSPAPCTTGFLGDIVKGLDRVQILAESFKIAAVNMSLGGDTKFTSPCDSANSATTALIASLRSRGIATIISSGNDKFSNGLSFPACISSAISVGSTGDGSEGSVRDGVSSFSNSASFLNLLAPGEWINSSVPGGGFSSFPGTSMAAPHVAGAIAVLKSKVPSSSVDAILSALTSTGIPITDFRNGIVKPRIQLDAALNALTGGNGPGQFAAGGLVTLTADPSDGFAFVKWQRDGADFSTSPSVNVTMNASFTMTAVFSRGPDISSVRLQTPKILVIDGVTFGQAPRVIINGVDRSGFIKSTSPSSIKLKGKQKKLGLRTGDNTIQVIGDGGAASGVFVLRL